MNFLNVEMIPGVVINADDPEMLGRIKCVAPGIFDTNTMPEEVLPWVYPWFMNRYQSFSKMFKGSKVWLIKNNSNKHEYWYMPMFEYIDTTREWLKANYDNDPEILISRNSGSTAQFTYDNRNGYNQKIGDNHIILMPNGNYEVKAADANIKIEGSQTVIGNFNEEYEPGVMGNKLVSILSGLNSALGELVQTAASCQYTVNLQQGFIKCQESLKGLEDLLTKNTKFN